MFVPRNKHNVPTAGFMNIPPSIMKIIRCHRKKEGGKVIEICMYFGMETRGAVNKMFNNDAIGENTF